MWYIFSSLIMFLTGCAIQTYPGERLSADQIALVEGFANTSPKFYYTYQIFIGNLDGSNLKPTGGDLEVLPGEHTVILNVSVSTTWWLMPIATSKLFTIVPCKMTFKA